MEVLGRRGQDLTADRVKIGAAAALAALGEDSPAASLRAAASRTSIVC